MAIQTYTFQNGDELPLLPLQYQPISWELKHPKRIVKSESRSQRIETRSVGGGRIEGTFQFAPMKYEDARELITFLRYVEGGHQTFALRIPFMDEDKSREALNVRWEGEYFNLDRSSGNNQLVQVISHESTEVPYDNLQSGPIGSNGDFRFVLDGETSGTNSLSELQPGAELTVEIFDNDMNGVDRTFLLSNTWWGRVFHFIWDYTELDQVVITFESDGTRVDNSTYYSIPATVLDVHNPLDLGGLDTDANQTDQYFRLPVGTGSYLITSPAIRDGGTDTIQTNRALYPPTLQCSLKGPVQMIKYPGDDIIRLEIDVVERW